MFSICQVSSMLDFPEKDINALQPIIENSFEHLYCNSDRYWEVNTKEFVAAQCESLRTYQNPHSYIYTSLFTSNLI